MPLDNAPEENRTTEPVEGKTKYRTMVRFDHLKQLYPQLRYPELGEVVTLAFSQPHINHELRAMGIQLLHFVEYPGHPGFSERTAYGEVNFKRIEDD